MTTPTEARDLWAGIDRVADAAARVTLSVEKHIVECTQMRVAVDLKLNSIKEDLRQNIATAKDENAKLQRVVIWAAGLVMATEALGLRAVIRALAQYFNIPLPG